MCTDHDKPHFDLFFTTKSTSIFFRARAEKGIAQPIDMSSMVWTLINKGTLAIQIVRLAEIGVKDNVSKGCATKMEFPEGEGGSIVRVDLGKSRGDGGRGFIGKIPSVGGGGNAMDILFTAQCITKKLL